MGGREDQRPVPHLQHLRDDTCATTYLKTVATGSTGRAIVKVYSPTSRQWLARTYEITRNFGRASSFVTR